MKVYGSRISYYTGKLEAYLRYKQIDYHLLPTPYAEADRLKEKVGAVQMPIVENGDQWMSDTTPIIEHFERLHPARPVMPSDPVVQFIACLIEDYADEWLWRPAMYYRWYYRYDRELASGILTDELTGHLRLPRFLRRRMITKRQVTHYVDRDGVTSANRAHIEGSYRSALAAMTRALENRPFLLGNAPSFADYGMMGPMFRHFGQDPTPQEIMRTEAPLVFEWVARMWRADDHGAPQFVDHVPQDLAPLLKEVCETHFAQLAANADAFGVGKERFDMEVQGAPYRDIATSRYRMWCLEELRRRFAALGSDQQAAVKALLPYDHADLLWGEARGRPSEFNIGNHLPFGAAINVFEGGLP